MFDVLIKALGFVIVIVIGFLLKQFRILKKEDGYTLYYECYIAMCTFF